MLIISQHARLLSLDFPKHAVFRVNVAWLDTREELFELLGKIDNDVFLDFPKGRRKPPRPVLVMSDLVECFTKFKNIKYFGVTNVKTAAQIEEVRAVVGTEVKLVPKIESMRGIDNLESIIGSLKSGETYIMLDKEDLYTDLQNNNQKFLEYLNIVREKAKRNKINILELQGVIFSDLKPALP